MCLAVPALVVELLPPDEAIVDLDGVRQRVSLALVDGVAVGDHVIVHVGFALQKLDVEEAEATLSLLRELAQADPPNGNAAP
jgi:hydrogenase expression/formation protein HypC